MRTAKTYTYPNAHLGITVQYTEISDGSTNTEIDYNLTEQERNAQAWPANVDTWKAAKATELGLTLQEYEDAVTAEAANASRYARSRKKAEAVPRIMARWTAYNEEKLSSGSWSAEDFASFMQQVGPVTITLYSLALGTCKQLISGFNHPLATPQAIADYLQIIDDEYPAGAQ